MARIEKIWFLLSNGGVDLHKTGRATGSTVAPDKLVTK